MLYLLRSTQTELELTVLATIFRDRYVRWQQDDTLATSA
jgi:hypothetical protein